MNHKLSTALLIALACILQSGCATLRHDAQPPPDHPEHTAATRLLLYSRSLLQASPDERMNMLAAAKQAYHAQHTAAAAARLALTYGQPDYAGYAPAKARHYARKALDMGPAHWGSAATTYLRQFAALCAESADVREQLAELRNELAAARQQQQALQSKLKKAHQKIKALTRLEAELEP